jgi:esterase/lipase superfamily enzyme
LHELKKRTSNNAKKNLKQNKRIPRISTRGLYDLATGKTKKNKSYGLYPTKFFDGLDSESEITIMIHGLRNNKSAALAKFAISQSRLRRLGYSHPVIGFSYDSNTKGVQYKSHELHATKIGVIIAKKNGKNLAKFIIDTKRKFPHLKIRLLGHSLGSQVILSALHHLKNKQIIEAAYVFGASIPSDSFLPQNSGRIVQKTIQHKFVNYYSKFDGVLKYAYQEGLIPEPIGYSGTAGKSVPKYVQKHVRPDNHRFVSYAKTLKSYP